MNVTQRAVKELIKQFAGEVQILTIPRPFVAFTGDHVCALLLSQIVYWSERTDDPEGWFYKTLDGWAEELCLTPFQVRRATQKLKEYGVESKLRKRSRLEGPKLHYRINDELFTEAFTEFLNTRDTSLSDSNVKKLNNKETASSEGEETSHLNNEETSFSPIKDAKITRPKITQRPHTRRARASAAPPPAVVGVSVSKSNSKFSEEERAAHAEANKLGDGWLYLSADGRFDSLIERARRRGSREAVEAARSAPPDNGITLGEARQHVLSIRGLNAGHDLAAVVEQLFAAGKIAARVRDDLLREFAPQRVAGALPPSPAEVMV